MIDQRSYCYYCRVSLVREICHGHNLNTIMGATGGLNGNSDSTDQRKQFKSCLAEGECT